MLGGETVEGGSEKLAERVTGGVGKISHDEIEFFRILIEPAEGVGVDDMHARRHERMLVEFGQDWMRGKKLGHFRIQLYLGNAFDAGVFENLADREPVAA